LRILTFIVAAWLLLGLDQGFTGALELGQTGVRPILVFSLVVLVSLWAPPMTALSAALVLGLFKDLLSPISTMDGRSTAIAAGPYALGFLLAAQFILAMRGLMNKRNPLTFAGLAMAGCLIAQAVVVAILSTRSIYDPLLAWKSSEELVTRVWVSVYTGVAGLALAMALIPLAPAFGFQTGTHRRFARGRS
jgi:hypothetical protein